MGAKTVNGPSACSADTRFACVSAATRESCAPVDAAVAGMSRTSAGGMRTLSITWITPLLAGTSASVTVASPMLTAPSATVKVASSPFSIVTVSPSVTAEDSTDPEYTW